MIAVVIVVTALAASNISVQNYKKNEEAKLGDAEEKARIIIDEALKTAETKKREALLEAKEDHKNRGFMFHIILNRS